MNYRINILILSTSFFVGAAGQEVLAVKECPITKSVFSQPPDDPNADPFPEANWYVNSNKSIWAGWDATNMKVGSNKVLWIRPRDSELQIEAEHLSGDGLFIANIPGGYVTGFQSTAMSFTEPGCWKVFATADSESIEFTTLVKK